MKSIYGQLLITALLLGLTTAVGTDSQVHTTTACLIREDAPTAFSADNLSHTAENYATPQMQLRHWSKTTVTLTVKGASENPALLENVSQAITLWNAQVGQTVLVTTTDKVYADIALSFTPACHLPPRTLGQTSIVYGVTSGTMRHADIVMQDSLKGETCLQAIAHELGHALGIQGHSPSRDDMMFEKAHLPASVTYRDANTLRIGYSAVTKDTPTTF